MNNSVFVMNNMREGMVFDVFDPDELKTWVKNECTLVVSVGFLKTFKH